MMEDVSNPCASGRCSSGPPQRPQGPGKGEFQTPAPRGGVPLRLLRGRWLHRRQVSNPCASGRCSSDDIWHYFGDQPQCFKPLRLGAVFLCYLTAQKRWTTRFVSNPCASGRCSSAKTRTCCTICRKVSNPCASGRCSSDITDPEKGIGSK